MELTKHRSTLLLLLVSLFAASQSASFYGNSKSESEFGLVDISDSEQTQSCSQSCAQLYSQVQYETGKTYIYDVDLTTRIGQQQSDEDEDDESNDEQTVKISAHADISIYSSCELVLKLRKVHLSGVQGHSRMAQQLEAQPLHFAYEDGKIVDLCASPADDKWIVDVKKSIVSALQMSSSDITKKQTVIETDISGQCETVYQPIEQTGSRTVIRKIKQMNKCGARHQFNTAFFPRSYGLDQALRSSLPFISSNATNECTLVIKNQIVEQVTCADKTRVWPLGVKVASHLSVKLIEKKPTLSVQPLTEGFRKHRLTMSMPSSMMSFQSKRHSHFGQQEQEYSVNDVQQLLVQIGQHVQTAVQSDVPVLFAELIHALPSLSVAEQSQLWEQVRSHEISPSNKLIDIFLDASALAGNEGSAQVLINAYQQQQISQQRANYLFGLLSFAKQPTVEAAQRLVQFVQQIPQQQLVEIPRGIIFGITGFVHNLQVVQQQANVHSPQIDQLVQTLSTLLVQTLQQQIGQVSNQLAEHQLLTIAYALRNLILAPVSQQQKQQDQPQITQQLIQILQQVPYTQYNQEVRVAIVRTLVTAGINDDIRQYLLEHVIPNTQEGIEIQIEAYRAVVLSGATQHQLEQILAFTEQMAGQPELEDLVNYIRSHQANLRTTSDPQKQTILPVNAPVFPRPSGQFFGISRNYEISYVNQELNVGVTAETDIIFNQQQTNQFAPVPQTVSFNLTIPIGGAELQLVEVRLHQHGLEPVIARHLAKIQRSGEKDPWKVAKETVEYIIEHGADILAENPQVHLLIQISVDGKTVLLIDEQDVISGELKEQTFVQELMSSLHQQVTIDRAFAITPIDTQISFPSVNGLPVQVRVNSSVVLGLRTDLTFDVRDFSNSVVQFGVWPSVASQLETAVEFTTGPEQRSIELVQNFYSAPQLNLVASVKNGHKISVKVDLPEDQYILARYESQLYTRNQQGQRVRVNRNIRQQQREDVDTEFVHVCTNSTQDVLGVVLCYDFTYSTPNQNSIDVVSQISLVKTDPQMKSYELYLETPYSIEKMLAARGRSFQSLRNMEQPFGQLQPFKFVFNTPGSEIDREIVLEVELPNSGSDLVKDARLRIQTPWKKVLAQASVRAEPKERSAAVEIAVDGEKFLQMELALETIRRGQKTEYRPRLTLAMQSVLEKPVQLEGVLMASAGRKSSIHFQLEDTQAKRQYIKGTYIRERGDRQSFLNARTSADVKISLLGLNAKMATSLEATDRLVNLDASAEYQLPSWERKEQARIGFKVQNLSQGKTVKLLNFGVVKISQFPKYQVRLSQNLLYTPSEQFEQDFKLGWAADDDEQIRLYQSLKTTTQRGKLDVESQAIVVYRPADINYEVRGTAGFSGFGVPTVQKRYQLQLSGQSRSQQWTEANFKAEYFWEQLSKSPLKMTMKATLKNAQVDFIYSDEIEEQSPAKYHGHVLIQITPEEKFSADYVYQIKRQVQSEADFEEHELELEVKNSRSQRIYRKHGLLRMEPAARSILIRSKLSSDESGDIFDGELKKVAGKTNFVFTHYPKDIRAKMQLDNAGNGQWELSTPTMKHESQFEYVPRRSWQFASKTKRNAKNWLEIDAKSDRIARSHRFALNSAPFEGEYLMELPEGRDQKAQIRVQMPASWSHSTSISRKAAKPYITLDSRTKFGDSNIADLAAKYDAEDEHYFRLNTPLARTDLNAELAAGSKQLKKVGLSLEAGAYSHQSKLSIDNQDNDDDTEYDFESTTRKSDKPIVNLRYKLADNVHNFVIDSPQFLEAQAKANLARSFLKPYASIDAKWTDKWTGQPVHHKSKLTGERDSQSDSLFDIDAFQFESQTLKNQNQNLAQIEASLSKRRNQKSFAQIRIGDRLSSKIELEPYKSASLKIDAPEYDHLTELTYQPSEQDGKWRIQSQTIALKKQNQKYLIDAEHQRNQRSAFKIDVPQFESQLAYEHPLSDLANHQMLFAFNGKSMESPLEHKTQMRWLNQGKQNPQIRLDSQTFRKSPFSGEQENVLSIEGAYNHNDSQMPSSLKLKYGKTLSGDLDMSLFDPSVKVLNLSGQLKDDRFFGGHQYTHQTQARFQPLISRLSVESNTDKNGQSVAQLKTLLSGDLNDKSYINLKAGIRSPMKALMELEPRGRRALVDFDFAPYQHRTEFSKQMQGPFQLKTVTSRDEKNLLDIDGQLFPTLSEQSYLKVKANSPYNQDNLYEGEFSLHPEKRFGQLSLRTNSLNHDSMFKLDDDIEQSKTALFKTNTVYRDQVLAKIDARLRGLRGENSIDAQLPQMTLKTLIDVPTKKGSFDVQHHRYRRHLLGSVAINQQQQQFDSDKSFHFDLAWDVDRNPASKVQIDLTARKIPSQRSSAFLRKSEELVVIASAQYGASKIVFNSEIVPQQVMQNPVRVSLAYVPLDQSRLSESWQLIYSHTMQSESQYQCKWDFLVGEQIKYGLQINSQLTGERFQFGAQTQAPQKPHLQVTFNMAAGVRKPGEQYYMEATAVQAETNRYQVTFDLTKHLETRKLDGTLELRFPNFEVHVVAFSIDLVQKQFKLDVTNEKTGKQVDVEASYSDNLMHLNAVSNIPFFPAVDAKIRYVPGEIVHAKLDLDQQRKFELTVKYTGELSTLQFYALTKVDSVYTPSVELIAEGSKNPDEEGSHQRSVIVTGKYNMVPVLSANLQQQDVQQWTAEGQISSLTGEKIVEASVQAIPVQTAVQQQPQQQYLVRVSPRSNSYVQPFVATIDEQQPTAANGHVRAIKIELTQPVAQQLIASAQIALKHRQWIEVPQMIEVTLQHVPSNSHGSFRVSIREQIDSHYLQQQKQQIITEPSLFDTTEQTTGVSSKRISRQIRDQAVVSWNQKAAGFSLLTTQYATSGNDAEEHDFKLYSPSRAGRVLQVRCAHQFSSTLFFFKQQFKTDLDRQREPIYQYTVMAQIAPNSGYTGRVQLESFKFVRSPKTVEFTIEPATPTTPVDVKLRIDAGASEDQAVTVRTVVQRTQSQNQVSIFGQISQNHTLHFSAKTQDRTVLDFEIDGHVSDSSVGLVWQNLNRKGQRQQGQYLVRFIGQDRFEAVIATPAQRYLVQGVYKRKTNAQTSPLVMDFVVSKLVSKQNTWGSRAPEPVLVQEHKVHIESVDKCIRAEIEDISQQSGVQQQESTRQVNICLDLTRSSLVQVEVDSIKNGRKTAEFNARLDARSVAQALQLSLKWEPKYTRQIVATLLQLSQQSQQTLTEQLAKQEWAQEIAHKLTVGQQLVQDFALEPIYKIVIDELMPILEEFGITQQIIQKWAQIVLEPVEQVYEAIEQYLEQNYQNVEQFYEEVIQSAQKTCYQSRTCSRLATLISQVQSSEDLARLVAEPLVQLLQKTHRIVVHSQGKLIRQLPEFNFVEQFVPEAVQQFIGQTVETIYEYVRDALVNPQTGVTPFAGIVSHLEVIVQELLQSAEWRSVNWERIQQALEQAVQLLVSPRAWSSSVRVLLWDPQNGQLQVQIKSPAGFSVRNILSDNQTNSSPSNSSWFGPSQKSYIINRQPGSNISQQQQQPSQSFQGPISFLFNQGQQEQIPQQQQQKPTTSYWSQWRQQQQQQQAGINNRNTGRYY